MQPSTAFLQRVPQTRNLPEEVTVLCGLKMQEARLLISFVQDLHWGRCVCPLPLDRNWESDKNLCSRNPQGVLHDEAPAAVPGPARDTLAAV